MTDQTPEQLKYLAAAAPRAELLGIISIVMGAVTAQMEGFAALRDGRPADLAAAIEKTKQSLAELMTFGRELSNEGVDPDWNYRA